MARLHEHTIVDTMPANALKVALFAAQRGCTTNYIYKLIKQAREDNKAIGFNVINFQGTNYIIPVN